MGDGGLLMEGVGMGVKVRVLERSERKEVMLELYNGGVCTGGGGG